MIHKRGSLGSEMLLPVASPSDAFHLFIASSSLSREEMSAGSCRRMPWFETGEGQGEVDVREFAQAFDVPPPITEGCIARRTSDLPSQSAS